MTKKATFSVFLENNRNPYAREAAYIYQDPVKIINVTEPDKIDLGLEQIEQAMAEDHHVAGWISYEAGLCFEEKLKPLLPTDLSVPLIYMGVFEKRKVLDSRDAEHHWHNEAEKLGYALSNLKLSQSREKYRKAFDKIQGYLSAGDIYQVNYTQKATFDFEGSSTALYAALRNAQAVEFAAFIESDDLNVLSLSPELFVRKEGDVLTARPMKGTGRRGRFEEEDKLCSSELYQSEKDRAENLMIVDLLRNDLSKLAQRGTVEVLKLYEVEKYRTLFTMTSTVRARADEGLAPTKLVRSIFPCGSVTGAPKIRAQQIISELEEGQRGIYTGAIGYFAPSGDMCLSVPIRTLTIDSDGKGELGIGGGIVADSKAEKEYDECLLKAEFLTKSYPRFDLIESLGWSKVGGFDRLDGHLDRLESSAAYFSFKYDRDDIRGQLKEHASHLLYEDHERVKVRLLLSKTGAVSISSEVLPNVDPDVLPKIAVSSKAIDSSDPMYFHKTTRRDLYETELHKYRQEHGCIDVIFTNERGEVTEGSYTNIFIQKDGLYFTPKRTCGLLAGIYREYMLRDSEVSTQEVVLSIRDLQEADHIFLCNSVRGLFEVELIDLT